MWVSRDPVGERGGRNLYGVVGNDGVSRWDILGLTVYLLDSGNHQEYRDFEGAVQRQIDEQVDAVKKHAGKREAMTGKACKVKWYRQTVFDRKPGDDDWEAVDEEWLTLSEWEERVNSSDGLKYRATPHMDLKSEKDFISKVTGRLHRNSWDITGYFFHTFLDRVYWADKKSFTETSTVTKALDAITPTAGRLLFTYCKWDGTTLIEQRRFSTFHRNPKINAAGEVSWYATAIWSENQSPPPQGAPTE